MPKPVFPIVPPYTPELLPVVQYAVEKILFGPTDVFEYGSGVSTLWLARFANIVTVEHDEKWYGELVRALEVSSLFADHHLVPKGELPYVIDQYGMFDLVLVDCNDAQRNQAAEAAMPHVKPGLPLPTLSRYQSDRCAIYDQSYRRLLAWSDSRRL